MQPATASAQGTRITTVHARAERTLLLKISKGLWGTRAPRWSTRMGTNLEEQHLLHRVSNLFFHQSITHLLPIPSERSWPLDHTATSPLRGGAPSPFLSVIAVFLKAEILGAVVPQQVFQVCQFCNTLFLYNGNLVSN